jgi:hypothetical protein
MNVFLSYARKDGDLYATRLRAELSSAGLVVWRDTERLVASEDWREQIRDALRKIDAVVLLLTPGAGASQYVTIECEIALALQKPVVPVLCITCDIPEAFIGVQYRDLSQPPIYSRELLALTRDLKAFKEAERKKILNELSALREDRSLLEFHQAMERLQRWLNGGVYETGIISAVVWLFRQMSVDSKAERPVHVLIDETVEGSYVQPNWSVYELFSEQRPVFEYILLKLRKDIKEPSPEDGVPIVLAVMNEAEAQALIDGSAFEGYPEEMRNDFGELQTVLANNNVGEWPGCYRRTPEEWRPFAWGGELVFFRLHGAGLVQRVDGRTVLPRCTLYADYFRERLNA